MSTLDSIQKMEVIKHWAERSMTGTPAQLSDKLHISLRTTYRLIDMLKHTGVSIAYNRHRQSYVIKKNTE